MENGLGLCERQGLEKRKVLRRLRDREDGGSCQHLSNPRTACSVIDRARGGRKPPRTQSGQKATTPSTMNPLNFQPLRMSVAGKSRYFWFTHSALVRMFGVRNQPPPTCERFTVTSGVPTVSWPLTVL